LTYNGRDERTTMKQLKNLAAILLAMSVLAGPFAGLAGEQNAQTKPKPKPYILKTCPVSGGKLGAMGDPYVFEYKGREIKLCCKGCLKEFNKNAAKYIKQIEQAEAKEKAKAKK